LVATVVRRTDPATLAPASERQDHTTLPSARKLTRLVNCRVHRIPLPTSVTIAIRPSGGGGMGEKVLVICPTPQARFTATHWHDGQFAHGTHARCACRAKSVRPSRRSLMKIRRTPRQRVSRVETRSKMMARRKCAFILLRHNRLFPLILRSLREQASRRTRPRIARRGLMVLRAMRSIVRRRRKSASSP
jgi:hypothetical protein